ncbi:MAG TPA: peptidylprolyl isomerase [Candidatus Nanoarchaeia archaeon]|nr:peptidylprolyl isomerase [Candidatus Nanoarchaeia archaeon]
MPEKAQLHDFIELDYTGKLENGVVFDTTQEQAAKKSNIFSAKIKYSPLIICLGEKQLLPGLDSALSGAEIGMVHEIILAPESAFGKRDIKKMRVVPMATFIEHKVNPQPGLEIDVDGERGIVSSISGGRVIVNFNHPLAGRKVIYTVKIIRKITDLKEQVAAYLAATFRIPEDKFKIAASEGKKVEVELPVQFPPQIIELIDKKLLELTSAEKIEFKAAKTELKSN